MPSLFRGIHVRVFDILGAGILPLCEYSADLERVFEGIELPVIRNYREAEEVAQFWLNDEKRRKSCIEVYAREGIRALYPCYGDPTNVASPRLFRVNLFF